MNIQTLREKYPQYYDLSDKQLADAIHNKFYSDMPINQFYAKIGFQQSQPQNNINSQPQQNSTYTQPQKNNYAQSNITQSKITSTQSQIVINTNIKNKDNELPEFNIILYFFVIAVQIVFILIICKRKSIQKNRYNDKENSLKSYKLFFNFSLLITTLTFIGTLAENNQTSHGSFAPVFILGYQTWLFSKNSASKLVNFTKFLLWLDSIIFLLLTGIAINLDTFNLRGTELDTIGILFYDLLVLLNITIYYNLLNFFKNQVIIESESSASSYGRYNESQYEYGYKKQKEYTSSGNQNNYKRQDDDTSNNNNNYQYEKKQNDQSYHSKNSDSNPHSTFDDRLDELKSNIAKCYEILEVPQNATPSEIKAAFKKKMSSYHPDKVSGLGEKLRKVAEEESKLINVAYQTLKSKGKC